MNEERELTALETAYSLLDFSGEALNYEEVHRLQESASAFALAAIANELALLNQHLRERPERSDR